MRRRIVLIEYDDSDGARSELDPDRVLRQVATVLDSPQNLIAPLTRMVIAVATPDATTRATAGSIEDRCREFIASVDGHGVKVRVAIGSAASGVAGLNISSRDAFDALQWGHRASGNGST